MTKVFDESSIIRYPVKELFKNNISIERKLMCLESIDSDVVNTAIYDLSSNKGYSIPDEIRIKYIPISMHEYLLTEICKRCEIEVVEKLLERSDIDVNLNASGYNLAMSLCESAKNKIVKILLNRKDIDLDMVDSNGYNIFMWACKYKNSEIILELLHKLDSIKLNMKSYDGHTGLYLYLTQKSLQYFKNINLIIEFYKNKNSILHIINDNLSVKNNSKISCDYNIIKLFSEKLSNENIYETLLNIIPNMKRNKILGYIIDPSFINMKNVRGITLLMHTIRRNYSSLVQKILNTEELDINIMDNRGYDALRYSIRLENIFNLIFSDPRTNINKKYDNGNTILHEVCIAKSYQTIDIILESDININELNDEHKSAIFYCDENSGRKLIKHKDIDLDNITDSCGDNILHYCIKNYKVKFIKLLLRESNINPNKVNMDNQNNIHPIFLAVKCYNLYVMEEFINHDLIDCAICDDNNKPLLQYLLENGSISLIYKILVNYKNRSKLNLNIVSDIDNTSLIMHAIKRGNKELSQLIMEYPNQVIDLNIEDKMGNTVFHYATLPWQKELLSV